MIKLTRAEKKVIEPLVACFEEKRGLIDRLRRLLADGLADSKELAPLIHSIRSRTKDPDHLRDKLQRKFRDCQERGVKFRITPNNLLLKINDLAGVRILHLHTSQAEQIDAVLKKLFLDLNYKLLEGPGARTWDDEYRNYFNKIGFKTKASDTMYTSVHYVIGSGSQLDLTYEIQMRTLMEEVWGEVDHKINYPHKTTSVACREQIRALARATSSSTRLVDSIFATVDDINKQRKKKKSKPKRPKRKNNAKQVSKRSRS